jgi:hypothetical protein
MSELGTEHSSSAPRYIGVGCFMSVAGFFSGAMIGVFIGKFVGIARRCIPDPGLPVCDWHLFAAAGGLLGAVSLPVLVLWRLRQAVPAAEHSDRG